MRPARHLEQLRSAIRAIESPGLATVPTGIPALDAALPGGGWPTGCFHEVAGLDGTAPGFAAWAATLLPAGPVLWVGERPDLAGAGLEALGLDPARLILARAGRAVDILWCMEEGLRTRGLAAVIGELQWIDLTAGRRLQLAAAAGATTGLLLSVLKSGAEPPSGHSAAVTRWHIEPAPSRLSWGWRANLMRARGGAPASFHLEWDHATDRLRLAAELEHRPAMPETARLAG